jgi:hypothetical protein
MKTMQLHYSDTADKPLIHINDLDTLKARLMVKLGLDEDEFDSHVLIDWTDSVNEQTRRHCVNPLVHVLVSEYATNLIADRTPFLPYMFTLESTPRNMDWVIAFYPAAFKRLQEFAFTENRKLLRLEKDNRALEYIKAERFKFLPLPGGPADHIMVFVEGADGPEPVGLGESYVPGEVIHINRNDQTYRVRVPNAVAGFAKQWSTVIRTAATKAVARNGEAPLATVLLNGVEHVIHCWPYGRPMQTLLSPIMNGIEEDAPVIVTRFDAALGTDVLVKVAACDGSIYAPEDRLYRKLAPFFPTGKVGTGDGLDIRDILDRTINGMPNVLNEFIDCDMNVADTLALNGWYVEFDRQSGKVTRIRSSQALNAGSMLMDHPTVAKIVSAIEAAWKAWVAFNSKSMPKGYGSAMESTTVGVATVKMTLVTPVGSELKAEAAVFKAAIDRARRRADKENAWQFVETAQGVTRWYFIPRNSGSFAGRLPLDLAALCQALNVVVVTDANGVLLTAANKDGEEISTSNGLGAMLKSAWKSTADVAAEQA